VLVLDGIFTYELDEAWKRHTLDWELLAGDSFPEDHVYQPILTSRYIIMKEIADYYGKFLDRPSSGLF
jgi:hypothetical protein